MSTQTPENALLAALPSQTYSRLVERLELRELHLEQVLNEPDSETREVYFPRSGVISLLTLTQDGESIEAALVGREGVAGFWLALGQPRSKWETLVQAEGEAWVMATTTFLELFNEEPAFRDIVLLYCGAVMELATQSIACNRFHEMASRTARWLLLMHDRSEGDEFRLTHHLLALMLGVHRPAVTVALRELAAAGIIAQVGRGVIRVLDRRALEDASCECYERAKGLPFAE